MKRIAREDGVALIVTLWVLVLLSVIAASFSFSTRSSSLGARNFKEDTQAYYAAVSVYEEAVSYLLSDPEPDFDYTDEAGLYRTDPDRPSFTGEFQQDAFIVNVVISDEESRINLNFMHGKIMQSFLEYNSVDEELIPEIIDTVADWIDPDDLHHLLGAETDYYETLGYEAKDRAFDIPEEVLFVKGIEPEMFLNNKALTLTTWGQGINVNTAPGNLLAIIGVGPDQREYIMEQREEFGWVKNVPPGLGHLGMIKSANYRIVITAAMPDSARRLRITAIVRRMDGSDKPELKTIYWKEDIVSGRA
jgi:general secretion pathway protein K